MGQTGIEVRLNLMKGLCMLHCRVPSCVPALLGEIGENGRISYRGLSSDAKPEAAVEALWDRAPEDIVHFIQANPDGVCGLIHKGGCNLSPADMAELVKISLAGGLILRVVR